MGNDSRFRMQARAARGTSIPWPAERGAPVPFNRKAPHARSFRFLLPARARAGEPARVLCARAVPASRGAGREMGDHPRRAPAAGRADARDRPGRQIASAGVCGDGGAHPGRRRIRLAERLGRGRREQRRLDAIRAGGARPADPVRREPDAGDAPDARGDRGHQGVRAVAHAAQYAAQQASPPGAARRRHACRCISRWTRRASAALPT